MLVDDDPFVRDVVLMALGALPRVRVTACAGAVEALAALDAPSDAIRPDLLLVDLVMPGMDGRALWNRVRARPNPPRAIFLTGRDDDATRAEILALGAQGLIAKPFDPSTLAETVLAADRATRARADKLATLARDFAAQLPAVRGNVERAWGKLAAWNAAAAETLLGEAHRVAGVAPMFGFKDVGKAADDLEGVLRAALAAGGWRTEMERARVEEALTVLVGALLRSCGASEDHHS